MHRVSDHLSDRYPYKGGFREDRNENQVSRAFGHDDVPRYCKLLALKDDLNDDERVTALTDLADVLANQENKTKAVASGVVPSMSRLLTVSNHLVRLGAARVLAAIAWDADGLVAMDKDPTLMFNLNSLLFDGQDACVEMATQVLVRQVALTTAREGIPVVLARSYIPEKLVSMASADDHLTPKAQRCLYEIFAQVTKSHHGAMAFAEVHVVPAILRVLHKPLLFPAGLLRYAVLTLWNLATHNQGKMEAIEGQAVERTVKVLVGAQKHVFAFDDDAAEQDLIRVTSGALMALATAEVAKPKLLATAIEPLVACLFLDVDTKHNASHAIQSMCEARAGLLPVVTLLVDHTALLLEVFGTRATPALNTLLQDNVNLPAVLEAIVAICDEADGVACVTQSLYMIDALASLCAENDDLPQVPLLAARIVRVIAAHDAMSFTRVERALAKAEVERAGLLD
ncbi:Aste57867_351 [Aphanomyces stellatus]|uniref:Aste57867_351 protein n=1 Tax=Aphanomyces stellatus TaxID=120398 RepID=A0A485K7K7_9STRA|nr:hypothetical protein As57867_000351 [Aphanomyces stellatus]VFT77577.1 Aste57867_351 [Aphanomyces stellatus]